MTVCWFAAKDLLIAEPIWFSFTIYFMDYLGGGHLYPDKRNHHKKKKHSPLEKWHLKVEII